MNSPFVLIVPGYPMVTDFNQIENTRFITYLPNPSLISEICFAVTPGVNIPAQGVALYFSFDNGVTWSILGTVTGNAPSGVFRTGWGTIGVESCSNVCIGISLEGEDFVHNMHDSIQSPIQRELPIMRVAEDLYNFITSFGSSSGNRLILPVNIIDQWLEKTKKKLQTDPRFFLH